MREIYIKMKTIRRNDAAKVIIPPKADLIVVLPLYLSLTGSPNRSHFVENLKN
jgi:hypothetical protein